MKVRYNNINLTESQINIRKSIFEKVLEKELEKKKNNQLKDFNFMSANLSRFMTNIPISDHWDIYIDIITTMRLREFDISDLYSVTDQILNNYKIKLEDDSPKLYVTCHLGFCKASMSLLILNGVSKIVLIVDDITYTNQAKKILSMNDKVKELFQINYDFKIINVEKPNSILEMVQLIKEGYSLFAYIDGNSGYKGVYNKEKTIEIPFMDSFISSRTGLAKIAYFTNTPIVPFVAYYDENRIPHMVLFDEIKRDNSINMVDFTNNTTLELYKIFESYIKKYFNQWESWFYIHKYLPSKILLSKNEELDYNMLNKESFESGEYSTFKIDNLHYLFNRQTFHIFPLKVEKYEEIRNL